MSQIAFSEPATPLPTANSAHRRYALSLLCALWVALFAASLFSPPVLDDADGTHANAARQMLLSGDWVTLRVNNVRYLEKAPLPYWITAVSFRFFGFNTFAAHLPEALSVLLLMLLGVHWAGEVYGQRAALYTGFGVLTSAGVFLFTRVFIPDVLLSLLLAVALYCFFKSLDRPGREDSNTPPSNYDSAGARNAYPYAMWVVLALAVLTKGLVAIVFLSGTAILFLGLTGEMRHWRKLRPFQGAIVFFAIAAPWHILAGLRNTGGMNGHGFFWFYFINEHVLRFLGRRIPRDYNKLPGYLYWSLHLVWLFPWALFTPVLAVWARKSCVHYRSHADAATQTTLLLAIFSAFTLLFFSLSTNQEYYTFPAYLPLLMLLAASLAAAERDSGTACWRTLTFAHATLTLLGVLIAAALVYGLWTSRHLAALPNVGDLLAHRGVGDYTLSMSSLFDLTGPSFAALRLPAALALAAFALGPPLAWFLRSRCRHLSSTTTIALTSAIFLIAAHIALARFAPMLSSQDMAAKIELLEASGAISRNSELLLYGDQAYGSSIPFYLNRPLNQPALLVDGRSSSMLFGSTFPDAQKLFLTPTELLAKWGTGERKLLFVPILHRDDVDHLLGMRLILLQETAGKALYTDRPLNQ